MRLDFVRVSSIIWIVLALVLEIVAVRSYLDDKQRGDSVVGEMLVIRADSALRSSYLEEISQLNANKRNDQIIGVIAGVLLTGGVASLLRPSA